MHPDYDFSHAAQAPSLDHFDDEQRSHVCFGPLQQYQEQSTTSAAMDRTTSAKQHPDFPGLGEDEQLGHVGVLQQDELAYT